MWDESRVGHREPGYATLFARGMIHSLCRTVSHHSGQIRPPFVHAKHQPGSFDVSDINVCACVQEKRGNSRFCSRIVFFFNMNEWLDPLFYSFRDKWSSSFFFSWIYMADLVKLFNKYGINTRNYFFYKSALLLQLQKILKITAKLNVINILVREQSSPV